MKAGVAKEDAWAAVRNDEETEEMDRESSKRSIVWSEERRKNSALEAGGRIPGCEEIGFE